MCGFNLSSLKHRNVHQLRRKLGMVFQDFGLLEDRSVGDNLDFALVATGWKDKTARKRRIEEVLTMVGLPHKPTSSRLNSVEVNSNAWPLPGHC